MNIIIEFLYNFWDLTNMVAIYIIFGIFIAAILKRYIKDSYIKKQVGVNKKSTIIKASLIGIPLPLCSCSVIPFALSLKKSGANKAGLSSFLVSTPVIGVDSFLASFGAFGWVFAMYRVVTSFITAMIAGLMSYYFDREKPIFKQQKPLENSCCSSSSCCESANKKINIIDYAYNELFKDIAKPMFYGLILATLLVTLLPKDLDSFLTNNVLVSYLVVLLISVPLYICATSSIPLGIALVVAGFSPGTAFLLLSAGPATSFVSIMVVKNILGAKGVVIYLLSIIISSIFFAAVFDIFFSQYISINHLMHIHEEFSVVSSVFTLLFFAMIIGSFKPKKDC